MRHEGVKGVDILTPLNRFCEGPFAANKYFVETKGRGGSPLTTCLPEISPQFRDKKFTRVGKLGG